MLNIFLIPLSTDQKMLPFFSDFFLVIFLPFIFTLSFLFCSLFQLFILTWHQLTLCHIVQKFVYSPLG